LQDGSVVDHSQVVPSPKNPETPRGGDVIALSRYRAQLHRGRRLRRTDEIFSTADPQGTIQALPGDEFFYLISELGFPDALEIFQLGSSEQVRTALDFALWDRDQLVDARADEWLAAMVEVPQGTFIHWWRGLDVELCAVLLRRRLRIYDLSVEEPPDEPEGMFLDTPDRLFTLDLLGEGEAPRVSARLIDAIYREDQQLARRLLIGVRSELDAEMEEMAYRWRSARMAELGFADLYEALEVYRELDPASVKVGGAPAERVRPAGESATNALRLPTALAERLSAGGTPFARAVAGVTDADELGNLHFALVALCNRALSADRVRPGDDERVAAVLSRVSATLDLGVEVLARGSEERAVSAVRTVSLTTIFRVGVSVLGKIRRLALSLEKQTPLGRAFFEPEDAEVLAAVTRLRPLFPRRLENPPAPGERPFASLIDVAVATAALERTGAALLLLRGLGMQGEQLAALGVETTELDTGVVARTLLVDRLGGSAGPLRALPPAAVQEFRGAFVSQAALGERVRDLLTAAAPGKTLTPAMTAVAERWAAGLLPLEPVVTTAGLSRPG
jgi:hypothetical protein